MLFEMKNIGDMKVIFLTSRVWSLLKVLSKKKVLCCVCLSGAPKTDTHFVYSCYFELHKNHDS